MAQYDVHLNRGPLAQAIPYVVQVQATTYEGYLRRVVVPLLRCDALPDTALGSVGTRLNPVLGVAGVSVVLHPLDIVSVPSTELGPVVSSLADQGQTIADAIDELLSSPTA